MEPQELNDALAHRKRVLKYLRLRLQQREVQEAREGSHVLPVVVIDKHELLEQIAREEAEVERLRLLTPHDATSIAEAEYRVIVMETWDTPLGIPSAIGAARLEHARLRLGIEADRTRMIEREARVQLAEQAWRDVHPTALANLMRPADEEQVRMSREKNEDYLKHIIEECGYDTKVSPNLGKWIDLISVLSESFADRDQHYLELIRSTLLGLGRIMRLHYPTLVRLLLPWINYDAPPDIEVLFFLMNTAIRATHDSSDFATLSTFRAQLSVILNDKATFDRIWDARFQLDVNTLLELDRLDQLEPQSIFSHAGHTKTPPLTEE